MATPKKAIPPTKTKKTQKNPTSKITTTKKNQNNTKTTSNKKQKTSNGAVQSPSSKKPQKKNSEQNGAKFTKAPTPKPKKNGKRAREEEPEEDVKSYVFPMDRVKRILRSQDSELRISSDAIFLINKATEKFVDKFSEDAHKCCVKDRKKAIAYKHLSSVVCKQNRYEFLSDFVPEKVKAEDALAKRKPAEAGTS